MRWEVLLDEVFAHAELLFVYGSQLGKPKVDSINGSKFPNMKELRKALQCSQDKVARKLHINQAAVSKIERRTDMYVSTLRDFIEAMGGSLEIIAQFPNSSPIRINQFTGME